MCGILGVYAKHEDVSRIAFFGLFSLQHRGQEGAGITVSDGKKIQTIRGLGLVTSVFNEEKIDSLKGYIAIGHTRYSTTGNNIVENVQPFTIHSQKGDFVVAHNGNIVNSDVLYASLKKKSALYSSSDTGVMAEIIHQAPGSSWEKKIINAFPLFQGAFSIVALTNHALFAFRDSHGFRPLVLGKLNDGYIISSETAALDVIGAVYERDIKPGEIIHIDEKGLHSTIVKHADKKSLCLFEYVYLSRPDSVLNNELIHQVRQRSGELLSYEAPVAADLVVAIPDSGTSAAIGYSKASGIPFGEALIKNRYIGRTFIQPEQRLREMGVTIKFNPLRKIVNKKRLIIVDDSIVRGITIKKIIQMLRHYGAKKIHVRICSPPIKHCCFFGIDTPDPKQLIASTMNEKQIKKFIGADSLKYLSLSGLIKAVRQKKRVLCSACFNGVYPVPVNTDFKKNILEPCS